MQHLRCTLQTTIGILLLLAAACGEKKAVPTSGPAGLVISVQGEVSATRPGEAPRALKVKDTIFGEDTLVTGPASSIEIELAHNGARWQLGADAERRVDTSVAWRAKEQKQALLDVRDEIKTGAAGRNTAREAAESRETLLQGQQAETLEEVTIEPTPERPASPKSTRKSSSRSKGKAGPGASSNSRQFEQPTLQVQSAQPAAPPPPPRPAPTRAEAVVDDAMESAPAAGSAPAPVASAPAPDAPKRTAAETNSLRSHVREVARRCHDEHGGRGTLTVAITVKAGKATDLRVTAPAALEAVRGCVRTALRGAALPGGGPLSEAIPLR